ncbi:hypothetical protein NBH08_27810 [Faecalicatena sp. BF-R-105]|nr:hypothetical protein [Faecalicatena sp. BF-R-105]
MTNTNNAIVTNASIIAGLTAENVKIDVKADNKVSVACEVSLLDGATEIETKAYKGTVKNLAKKALRDYHEKLYHGHPMQAIANHTYELFFENDVFSATIPAIGTLDAESKALYKEKVLYLQKFGAGWINSTESDSKRRTKLFTDIKKAMQDIFRAFDPETNINPNDKDVRMFLSTLGKIKGDSFSTSGDKAVMAAVEFAIYHKILGKEYFVKLYTSNKDWKDVIITKDNVYAEKPAKEEPAQEEPAKEEKEAA